MSNQNDGSMTGEVKDSSFFLTKKLFVFGVWNKDLKREDTFTIEQTVLPRDTDKQVETKAVMKLRNMVSTNPHYAGQKVRVVR